MEDNNSILNSVKKMLGLSSGYNVFDTDIIIHINSIMNNLEQIGIGKPKFRVSDANDKWSDYIGDDNIDSVKSYIYLKVKMTFDPPTGGSVQRAYEENIRELEWRLFTHHETDRERVIVYE